MSHLEITSRRASAPPQLWIGLLLIAVAWPLNWALPGHRTHLLFFPLWLGYALAVDGLVYLRKGRSLLTRSWRRYVGLFLVSAPAWWLFELLNGRTQNWEYIGRDAFTDFQYAALASLSFSTVIPAVFGTAELVSTLAWVRRMRPGPSLAPTRGVTVGFFVAGWIMLALLLAWPRAFFPFLWLSVYFILEPLNVWLGHRTLGDATARRDWRPIVALWSGTLICGFFWELWNFYAFPKWVYYIPLVDVLHVFEMPILGYSGYLPFGMELFALYHLITGTVDPSARAYVEIGDNPPPSSESPIA
jgi:hypothetical protein